MKKFPTESDNVLIDGRLRSRVNADGHPIEISTEGLTAFWRWFGDSKVVDEAGRPIPVYHGSATAFDAFSQDHQRSVLNVKYQGDGFCFSESEEVAWRYANASRNQCFNKERMYASLDSSEIPRDLVQLFKDVVEKGYGVAWDMPFEAVRRLLDSGKASNVDVNDFLDLAQFVEGTKYDAGGEPYFDASMIFGGSHTYLPDWARTHANALGLGPALPDHHVIAAYLKIENLLSTDERNAARESESSGYDGTRYTGHDLVDGHHEWVVFRPNQIKSVTDYGGWDPLNDAYQAHGSPRHLTRSQARETLVEAWYGGKNAHMTRFEHDPTDNHDGSGWIQTRIPLSLVRGNEDGLRYDGTVSIDRAQEYAQLSIPTPVHLVYGPRSFLSGHLTAAVHDGGHRVTAARLRGDSHIGAVMKRSTYRLLLSCNDLKINPSAEPAIARLPQVRP